MRIKKKIESDINEMEISLDHTNKANAETAKQIKRLAGSLLEIDTAVEEESRARADIEDQAGIAERKGEYFLCIFKAIHICRMKTAPLAFFIK